MCVSASSYITFLPLNFESEQWILVPVAQDGSTFRLQSALFPASYLSYSTINVAPWATGTHSQLNMRAQGNATVWSFNVNGSLFK